MSETERQSLLLQLIHAESPPHELTDRLRSFGWDSEVELVVLTRADAISALRRFVGGELTSEDVEQWADAIEGRDDVGLDPQAESLIQDLLFELANPAITRALTPTLASEWIDRLSQPR